MFWPAGHTGLVFHARYDRAEESSDIHQHVLLLGCAAGGLAIFAALAFAEARYSERYPTLLRLEQPATRKHVFTSKEGSGREEGGRSRPRKASAPGAPAPGG